MAGLRERQKADRRRRILEAALHMFRANGYRNARIEDVAAGAGVSVGTIYNYYQTKGDMLIATVTMEVEEVLAAGEAIVLDPPGDVAEAIMALVFGYYDHSLQYLTKEMWRHAMALAIEAPETPNGRHYVQLDRRLAAQVVALMDSLKARGRVRPEVEPRAIGQMIFNDLNQLFVDFVREEEMTLEDLRCALAAHVRPLARLMAVAS